MATRSASVRRDDLYHNLSLEHPPADNPFTDGPAVPAPVRQATHPALQAARAAATANQGARAAPAAVPGEPAMPSAASGANGSVSPSSYAQQFQAPASFSDAPRQQRHSKKPSLFRRSVVALTGSRMSHVPSRTSVSGAGLQRKPSALRKSMAWLLGPPAAVRLAPGIGDTPSVATEKSGPGKKDPFLGGGGEGSEWDVDGSGAAFWKRFSVAQRRAQNQADPLTMQSKEFVSKQKSANRKMRFGIYLSLVIIIGLIIGLAVGIPASRKHDDSDKDSSANAKRSLLELPADLTADASRAAAAVEPAWTSVAASPAKRHPSQGRTHQKFAHRRAVQAASQVAA